MCRDTSLDTQYLQEMELLDDSAIIYKMVGPVLVKQDPAEAKQTVTKRLDYITKEMYVICACVIVKGSQLLKFYIILRPLQIVYTGFWSCPF